MRNCRRMANGVVLTEAVQYQLIKRSAIEDTRLSLSARGLLCYLLSSLGESGGSRTSICQLGPDCPDLVSQAFDELEAWGYLRNSRGAAWVSETPQDV